MLSTLATIVLAAVSIDASDAKSLLESARALQAERWAEVDNYTVTLSVDISGGLQTSLYHEKMDVDGQPTFRMVPPGEYSSRLVEKAGFPAGKDVMAGMVPGLDMMTDALAAGGEGMPPLDLRGMTSQMSAFAQAGATYEEDDGRADAKDAMADLAAFAERAKLKGTEQVLATSSESGAMAEAYRLVADDLSDVKLDQPEGDARFTLNKITLWLEKEHLVPLRLLMDGEVEQDGEKMPLSIEKLDLDYQQVGPLYESHHQEYRLSGIMSSLSDKDRKEMEKAKVEFEKMKEQLESMPEAQKSMVEKMMKGQMEKFEAMMEGDAFTSTTTVKSIAINEGPPTPYGPGDLTVGGPAAATYPTALTVAVSDPGAELGIAAQIPEAAEATIGLICAAPFPQSGAVDITGATGHVMIKFPDTVKVSIEKGSGVITVTERTETRITGTYTALLTGRSSKDESDREIHFSASGSFDSGAPAGALKELRGSPIPVDLFEGP